MITLKVDIVADPVRAIGTARALRDQLEALGVAKTVELVRETAGRDAGSKSGGDILTLASVALTLLPVGAHFAIDWLMDYFRRPGASPVRVNVRLESGASVEAAFDPETVTKEEIVRIAAALKSVVEHLEH